MSWFDSDNFWNDFSQVMFNPERMARAEGEVRSIIELLGLTPPGPVLDLCCGPGRHTLELARLGYRATGVDRTGDYLATARETSYDYGLEVELVQSDVRRFTRPGEYAAALLMYTSFGFFDDPDDDLLVLRNACESLRPGGALVMDLRGKEQLAGGFEPRTWEEAADGSLFLRESELTGPFLGVRNRWIVIERGGHRREGTFQLRLYSAAELTEALSVAGFARVDIYGDLDGNPYDLDADRLVAVAHREG